MTDWNAVFATLPEQFSLGTMSAHKTAGEKPERARADCRRCCIQTACDTLTVIAMRERKQRNFNELGVSYPLVPCWCVVRVLSNMLHLFPLSFEERVRETNSPKPPF